jgi:TP901 family phage tail tape measure protein
LTRTRKLEVVLAGDAKGAVKAFEDTEQRARGFGGKMASAGKIAAGAFAAIGAAAGGAAVGLFKIGETFDEQYDKIRVGTGATGQALKGLKTDFKGAVSSVPTDFASAGTAVADLNTRLGLTGKPLQNLSGQFLELSRITETDVGENIKTVTRLFGDFGIKAADQGGKLDSLFRASQATGITISDLSAKMTQFGAPLRQLGFGFDESAALIAKFEKEGVNTEAILGGMRQALGRMARAGEAPVETFRRVTEQIKAAGSAGEANALAVEAFGARAGPDLAAAVREGRFELDDLLSTISGGSETIMQAGKDTQDFSEKWQMFKNRVLVALEPVAMRVFDAMGAAMDTLGRKVQALIDKWGPPLKAFVTDVLGSLRKWWDDNGPAIIATARDVFAKVSGAVSDFVAAARTWIAENGTTIEEWRVKISDIFNRVRDVIMGFIDLVKVAWSTFGQTLLDTAGRIFSNILSVIDGVLRVIKGVIDVFVGLLTGDWSRAWEGVKGIVSGAWEAIKGIVGLAIEKVRTIVSLVLDAIKTVFSNAWNSMRDTVHTILLTILERFLAFADGLLGAAEKAFGWIGPIGDKLREARGAIQRFREETNRELAQIQDKKITITIERAINEHVNRPRAGDGPGNIAAAGKAIDRARAAATGLPVYMSSAYRSPARNRAVGGSPTSYHLDRFNPASDWVGPTWALDELARRLRSAGRFRELLWRVPNHAPGDNPHVHYAHSGGMVERNWPTLAGLRADERPAVLQVGETIIPRRGPGSASRGGGEVHYHTHVNVGTLIGGPDAERWLMGVLASAKRKGYVGV